MDGWWMDEGDDDDDDDDDDVNLYVRGFVLLSCFHRQMLLEKAGLEGRTQDGLGNSRSEHKSIRKHRRES